MLDQSISQEDIGIWIDPIGGFLPSNKSSDWSKFNPLPKSKFLDWFKLRELADDKVDVTEKLKFGLGGVKVGKGENAGYQHFLLILLCFLKAFFPGSLKVGIVW